MEPTRHSAGVWWLPAIASALLAAATYQAGYAMEAGTRAGAEPGMVGLTLAFPFAVLALCDVLWAIDGSAALDRGRRIVYLRRMSIAAVVVAVLVALWMWGSVSGGYAVGEAVLVCGSIIAGLLLPLLPAWTTYGRQGSAADRAGCKP